MAQAERYTPMVHEIGGLAVRSTSLHAAADEIVSSAVDSHGLHFHLVNAYTVTCAEKDRQVNMALAEGAINYPDGKPLFWLSRYLHRDRSFEQVRGPALFAHILSNSSPATKHFFLGGTPAALERLEGVIERDFSDVQAMGFDSPPFLPLTREECDRRNRVIQDSGANIVWIGLGTPKQDLEAARITKELGVTTVAVGAAFNFFTGEVLEAPEWLQKYGLEWLYRLYKEPRRLWKRYLVGNLEFVWIVVKDILPCR